MSVQVSGVARTGHSRVRPDLRNFGPAISSPDYATDLNWHTTLISEVGPGPIMPSPGYATNLNRHTWLGSVWALPLIAYLGSSASHPLSEHVLLQELVVHGAEDGCSGHLWLHNTFSLKWTWSTKFISGSCLCTVICISFMICTWISMMQLHYETR